MEPAILEHEEEVVTPEPSLRETIEKAVDAEEGDQGKPPAQPVAEPAGKQVGGKDGSPAPSGTPEPKPEGTKPAAPAGTPAAAPDKAPAAPAELKAPSQWKPAVREKWNQLPREVQEEVLRREGDNLRLIGSVGQKLKFADSISAQIAPFSERLQSAGIPPDAFVSDVFKTVSSLANGTMEEKANVIANIVQSYGVDLATLDRIIAARITAPPPDPRVVQAQREAWEAKQKLERVHQSSQQHASSSAAEALRAFATDPKNEFYDDVRDMMADLLQAGRAKTLEEAYTACIWANPDTRKILLGREAQQRATAKGQRAAQARTASSSVQGAPKSPNATSGNPNATLRETLEAAFDEQTQL